MQVTIDIPEPRFSELLNRAEHQRRALEEVVLGEILRFETPDEFRARLKGRYPLVKSDRPGSMDISKVDTDDFLGLDDPS